MKLNHECIRDTLLAIESMNYVVENEDEICFEGISLDELAEIINAPKEKYSRVEIFRALQSLNQGGYIDVSHDCSDDSLEYYIINSITYSGHQFLDTVRDPTVWKKTKSIVSKVADASLSVTENVAAQVITNIIDRHMS